MTSFHAHYLIWKQLSEVGDIDVFILQVKKLRVQKLSFISSFKKYLLNMAGPTHEVRRLPGRVCVFESNLLTPHPCHALSTTPHE